jgi:hypothetical protein
VKNEITTLVKIKKSTQLRIRSGGIKEGGGASLLILVYFLIVIT